MKIPNVCTLSLLAFSAATLCALEADLKPGMDKEREAMIAQWKQTLESGDQAAVEKTLALAKSKAAVAFGMSDWPQAVAEAALRGQPPLQELLLNHLREHRSLINQATHVWIKELFKRDVFDPLGEQVRGWVKAGDAGTEAAAATVKKAAEAGHWDEAAELLDAVARWGNGRFLPLAASYLSVDNKQASQAALGVFKAHAKELGPDLRSPKICHIWWLQTGKALFGGK
jgi:hypothetical protein